MRGLNADEVHKVESFVLRVVDSMQPAAQSLAEYRLPEEIALASSLQGALAGDYPRLNAAFIASLRSKWTAAAMMQMRRARGLLDKSEVVKGIVEEDKTRWRADIAKHGLKECALPSCGKLEASVGQHAVPFVAPCGTALQSTGRCTGRSTSPPAAQPRPHSMLPREWALRGIDVVGRNHRRRTSAAWCCRGWRSGLSRLLR